MQPGSQPFWSRAPPPSLLNSLNTNPIAVLEHFWSCCIITSRCLYIFKSVRTLNNDTVTVKLTPNPFCVLQETSALIVLLCSCTIVLKFASWGTWSYLRKQKALASTCASFCAPEAICLSTEPLAGLADHSSTSVRTSACVPAVTAPSPGPGFKPAPPNPRGTFWRAAPQAVAEADPLCPALTDGPGAASGARRALSLCSCQGWEGTRHPDQGTGKPLGGTGCSMLWIQPPAAIPPSEVQGAQPGFLQARCALKSTGKSGRAEGRERLVHRVCVRAPILAETTPVLPRVSSAYNCLEKTRYQSCSKGAKCPL